MEYLNFDNIDTILNSRVKLYVIVKQWCMPEYEQEVVLSVSDDGNVYYKYLGSLFNIWYPTHVIDRITCINGQGIYKKE